MYNNFRKYELYVDNELFAVVFIEEAELENFREILSLAGLSVDINDTPMLDTHGGWYFENLKYHFKPVSETN